MENVQQLLVEGVVWYGVFLFSTVLHEAAHAWAALRLGDPTAAAGGQVSVDPVPHLKREPMGTIGVPLITFFLSQGQWLMGWASAPYNFFWALEHPKRAALMALAGPLANLGLVLVTGGVLRWGLVAGFFTFPDPGEAWLTHLVASAPGAGLDAVAFFVSLTFSLNLILFLFNLLPVPPLDGSAVLPLFLKPSVARSYLVWTRNPGVAMLGLLAAWFSFRYVIFPVFGQVVRWLYQGV